jgi:P-type Cu2+ transporter
VECRERRLNIDFLDMLAIGASVGQGSLMTGAIVTWLIRLGDWICDLTAAGAKRAVGELLEFRHKRAWVLRAGSVVAVPASELVVGDEVVVYHGEMIPVDGEVIDGRALIDQKTITGESLPVTRALGEPAYAATIVREGQITIRAIRVGSATTAWDKLPSLSKARQAATRACKITPSASPTGWFCRHSHWPSTPPP